jgi:hypothetical protein
MAVIELRLGERARVQPGWPYKLDLRLLFYISTLDATCF